MGIVRGGFKKKLKPTWTPLDTLANGLPKQMEENHSYSYRVQRY